MVNRPTVSTTHGRIPGRRTLPVVSSRALPTMSRPAATIRRSAPSTSSTTSSSPASNPTCTSSPIPIIRSAADKASEDCLKELQAMRQRIQARKNIRSPGSILTDTGLKAIVEKLPLTDRELMLVTNMKEEAYKLYGAPFLEISKKYFAAKRA
ncbi:hypothetical protein MUCCIDRAFT_156347 [Mucor lusitanicus CBS 277.49]|uniref:HRDC domain-containing protein n=1 Tax=Mucor lusitanicus CBS 277.49 TaxID=747725 RepID=A0A162QG28_MUCCL|nr:hypothetical protein MUCCIDRAFT_156347 [Mucor lusitanicus CBS 277.49]